MFLYMDTTCQHQFRVISISLSSSSYHFCGLGTFRLFWLFCSTSYTGVDSAHPTMLSNTFLLFSFILIPIIFYWSLQFTTLLYFWTILSFYSFLFKDFSVCLKSRVVERMEEGGNRGIFHPLSFCKWPQRLDSAKLKMGACNWFRYLIWLADIQVLGTSAAFPRTLAGSWLQIK